MEEEMSSVREDGQQMLPCDFPVPSDVPHYLCAPELDIACNRFEVLPASMSEASVNEYRDPFLPACKVCVAINLLGLVGKVKTGHDPLQANSGFVFSLPMVDII